MTPNDLHLTGVRGVGATEMAMGEKEDLLEPFKDTMEYMMDHEKYLDPRLEDAPAIKAVKAHDLVKAFERKHVRVPADYQSDEESCDTFQTLIEEAQEEIRKVPLNCNLYLYKAPEDSDNRRSWFIGDPTDTVHTRIYKEQMREALQCIDDKYIESVQ
jgi:hypothetical protein